MSGATPSLFDHVPRVRFTRHLPIDGTALPLTIWVGSVARGWVGKTLHPSFRGTTWRLSGVSRG